MIGSSWRCDDNRDGAGPAQAWTWKGGCLENSLQLILMFLTTASSEVTTTWSILDVHLKVFLCLPLKSEVSSYSYQWSCDFSCVLVCAHVSVGAGQGQRFSLDLFPQVPSSWSSLSRLPGWPVNPRHPCVATFLVLGLQVHHHASGSLLQFCSSQVPGLNSRRFCMRRDWTLFPALAV